MLVRIEDTAPYALAGDNKGDYGVWNYEPGRYTLRAVPYSEAKGKGQEGQALALTFEIRSHLTVGEAEAHSYRTALEVFPNPVQRQAQVKVTLSRAQPVHLAVYDLLGRQITVLYAGNLQAGTHFFSFHVARLAAGSYLCQLQTPQHVYSRFFGVRP